MGFTNPLLTDFRKVEDGCVDIYFYDWLYFGFYTPSPTFQLFYEGVGLPNQPKENLTIVLGPILF
jgi:hypothetical protein